MSYVPLLTSGTPNVSVIVAGGMSYQALLNALGQLRVLVDSVYISAANFSQLKQPVLYKKVAGNGNLSAQAIVLTPSNNQKQASLEFSTKGRKLLFDGLSSIEMNLLPHSTTQLTLYTKNRPDNIDKITLYVSNNTAQAFVGDLFASASQSQFNNTRIYTWDITGDALNEGTLTIDAGPVGGEMQRYRAPIGEETTAGVLAALNALGIGTFYTQVVGGRTMIYTYGGLQFGNLALSPNVLELAYNDPVTTVTFGIENSTELGTIHVDWGDGTVDDFTATGFFQTFTPSHTYSDSSPHRVRVSFPTSTWLESVDMSAVPPTGYSNLDIFTNVAQVDLYGSLTVYGTLSANCETLNFHSVDVNRALPVTLDVGLLYLNYFDPAHELAFNNGIFNIMPPALLTFQSDGYQGIQLPALWKWPDTLAILIINNDRTFNQFPTSVPQGVGNLVLNFDNIVTIGDFSIFINNPATGINLAGNPLLPMTMNAMVAYCVLNCLATARAVDIRTPDMTQFPSPQGLSDIATLQAAGWSINYNFPDLFTMDMQALAGDAPSLQMVCGQVLSQFNYGPEPLAAIVAPGDRGGGLNYIYTYLVNYNGPAHFSFSDPSAIFDFTLASANVRSISDLSFLVSMTNFDVSDCPLLSALPQLPNAVQSIIISNCASLHGLTNVPAALVSLAFSGAPVTTAALEMMLSGLDANGQVNGTADFSACPTVATNAAITAAVASLEAKGWSVLLPAA